MGSPPVQVAEYYGPVEVGGGIIGGGPGGGISLTGAGGGGKGGGTTDGGLIGGGSAPPPALPVCPGIAEPALATRVVAQDRAWRICLKQVVGALHGCRFSVW